MVLPVFQGRHSEKTHAEFQEARAASSSSQASFDHHLLRLKDAIFSP